MDWLPFLDPTHLFHLAQTPIAPPKTPEVELLRKQLDFIAQTNKDLNESFKTFVDTMKFVLVIFGFLGGAIAFIFGKNLDDAKKVARDAIRQEVEGHVTALVQTEVNNLKRTLQRERIISDTVVHYYLPNAIQPPNEFKLLTVRGFRDVRFLRDRPQLHSEAANIVILDLENWVTPNQQKFSSLVNPDRDTQAQPQIDALLNVLPPSTVLVVYVRSTVTYLYSVSSSCYITPANNPVTLIGMVADAAYVVAGILTP